MDFHWAVTRPQADDDAYEPAVDIRPGANFSRRRFVSLALYTTVGVLLSDPRTATAEERTNRDTAQGPRTDDGSNAQPGPTARPADATVPPLPCAPDDTDWYAEPGRMLELIDPDDIPALHRQYSG